MIQRIQSLYLLLTSLSSLLFLKGSILLFFNNSDSEFVLNFKGFWQLSETGGITLLKNQIFLPAIVIIIFLLSFVSLLLYKHRRIQLRSTIILIFVSVLFIGIIAFYVISLSVKYDIVISPVIRMFLPLMILLFSLLAYRGIKKDENLVRSYDRLR